MVFCWCYDLFLLIVLLFDMLFTVVYFVLGLLLLFLYVWAVFCLLVVNYLCFGCLLLLLCFVRFVLICDLACMMVSWMFAFG